MTKVTRKKSSVWALHSEFARLWEVLGTGIVTPGLGIFSCLRDTRFQTFRNHARISGSIHGSNGCSSDPSRGGGFVQQLVQAHSTFTPVGNPISQSVRCCGERRTVIQACLPRGLSQTGQRMISLSRRKCRGERIELPLGDFDYLADSGKQIPDAPPLFFRHGLVETQSRQSAPDSAHGTGHRARPTRLG